MKGRFVVILASLALALTLFCNKKYNPTGPGQTANDKITINATEEFPYGLDTLYVSPGDSMILQAATLKPSQPPVYQWSSGNEAMFTLVPVPTDSSRIMATAVGDSGAVTFLTVKDNANGQEKSIPAKVAVWADMYRFTYIGSLNKHHYFLARAVADWAAGKTICEDNHGHLVTIASKEENDMVKRGRDAIGKDVWIGLRYQWDPTSSDRSKDLKWSKWVNGETLTYTNWVSGKPDYNPIGAWDITIFVYMDAIGKWFNQRNMTKHYVLEIP